MSFSDKNVNDFLREFLANIKQELPGKSFKFSDFEAAFNKSAIAITKPDQYAINENEEMPWIEEYRNALFFICKIINNPRFIVTSYKEAVNVEKIVKIDSQDVMETSKKDSYWDIDLNGEVVPKKFVTSINERDICIYENRFIVFVIDLMLFQVNQHIIRLRKEFRHLSNAFSSDNFSFKDATNVLDLAHFKQFTHEKKSSVISHVPLLTSNKSDLVKNFEELEYLKKELLRLTFTPFYKTVKKSGTITHERVYSTNLLVGEHNYSIVFNFYLKYLMIRKIPKYKAPIYRPWYYDFVGLSLLMALKELGFTFNNNRIMFDEVHHLILQNYNCEKEGVKVHIDHQGNCIEITFTVLYIEGRFHKIPNLHQKRENRICLIMLPNPKTDDEQEVKKLYSSLIKEKLESGQYTNVFIVSCHDEFNYPNAIIVSPFASNIDLSLKNVIQSSLLFIEGDSKMYSKICPICGNRVDGEWDDGNCYCDECNSVWTSLISGDNHQYQNTIWLKAIKRPLND